MKKLIVFFMCAMMILSPLSVKAEKSLEVLELPEDDGSGYPVTGVSTGYNENPDVYKCIVPENILRLGAEVFKNNENLREIELHSKIQKIGKQAFWGTEIYKTSANWDESGVLYIGDCLIEADPEIIGTSYEVRPGTRLIAAGAFENCETLMQITIPDSIEYVGEDAFANTAFSNNPENWNQGILELDDLLLKVAEDFTGTLNVRDGIKTIADEAASGCWEITEVITPESLVHIGMDAFSYCESLERISLGANVETIGRGPFYKCNLKEIVVDKENGHFELSGEGILMDEELTHVWKCPQQFSGMLTLPFNTSIINAYAFEGCELGSLEIPEGCLFVGNSAFFNSQWLEEITLPESLEYIDSYAFAGCKSLEVIEIPDNVTYLGKSAFANCTNLQIAVLGDGIEKLQDNIFDKCHNLYHVELGRFTNQISETAFLDTKYLHNVKKYDENGLLIDHNSGCLIRVAPYVEKIEIPDDVQVIADGAFDDVYELKKVELPEDIFRFNWGAFSGMPIDVNIYYDGSVEKFEEIAGTGWEMLNLVTKDLRQMRWAVAVFGVFCFVAVTMIASSNRKNEEEPEDDYDEE